MKSTFRKNLLLVLFTVPLLFAFQCDDEYKPDEVVENLGLVAIEDDKKAFSVNDYIFITTSIANEQVTIDGKTINLRDYMSADVSDLYYGLQIEKIDENGEETPYIVTDVQEIEGTSFVQEPDPFFGIISPYNEEKTSFSSNIGVKLSETGTFTLKTGIIKGRAYIISFDTQSTLGILEVNTNIANSDEAGIYRFTVE